MAKAITMVGQIEYMEKSIKPTGKFTLKYYNNGKVLTELFETEWAMFHRFDQLEAAGFVTIHTYNPKGERGLWL
jgi:hypothetical protein